MKGDKNKYKSHRIRNGRYLRLKFCNSHKLACNMVINKVVTLITTENIVHMTNGLTSKPKAFLEIKRR